MTFPRHIGRRGMLAGLGATALLSVTGLRALAQTQDVNQLLHRRFLARLDLTEPEEAELGDELEKAMIRLSGGLYLNRHVQNAIEDFAQPLFEAANRQLFTWKISVIDNDTPGAWVLAGGRIGIHKGILRYAETPDELATIIAHEMGHAELGHLAAVMREENFANSVPVHGAEAILSHLQDDENADLMSRVMLRHLRTPIYLAIRRGYGPDRERAADDQIVRILRQTGHSLTRGAVIFDKVGRLVSPDRMGTNCLYSGPDTASPRTARLAEIGQGSALTGGVPYNRGFETLKDAFPTRHHHQFLRSAETPS